MVGKNFSCCISAIYKYFQKKVLGKFAHFKKPPYFSSVIQKQQVMSSLNSVAVAQAEQGVKECVSMSWYSFDSKTFTLEEWSDMQAESLWEHRTDFDEQRDLEGGVVLENYKFWALEKAQDLYEEE